MRNAVRRRPFRLALTNASNSKPVQVPLVTTTGFADERLPPHEKSVCEPDLAAVRVYEQQPDNPSVAECSVARARVRSEPVGARALLGLGGVRRVDVSGRLARRAGSRIVGLGRWLLGSS